MNIQEWCDQKGITVCEFARQLGMNESTLTRINQGVRGTSQKNYEKIKAAAPKIEFRRKGIQRNSWWLKDPSSSRYNYMEPGQKYGSLTILEDTGMRKRSGEIVWLCKCDCGNLVERSTDVIKYSVNGGYTISCGCQKQSDVGQRELENPERKEKAIKANGFVEGTMLTGINRKNMNKNNTSGVRGVHWNNKEKRWVAAIEFKRTHIRKRFKTKEEAIEYRKYLEQEYFDPMLKKYGREKNVEKCIMPDNPPKWRNERFGRAHRHEVFFGRNRKRSIEDGLVVFLTPAMHNMSDQGVHFNRSFDLELKKAGQKTWMEYYNKTAEEFIDRYGRNYL